VGNEDYEEANAAKKIEPNVALTLGWLLGRHNGLSIDRETLFWALRELSMRARAVQMKRLTS